MTTASTPPWYRQFWPWFIIGLPAASVIAGITTVFIAFNNADSLVNDNYYQDGLAINRQFAQDNLATQLALRAEVNVDRVSGELFVNLSGNMSGNMSGNPNFPDQLQLLLLHPASEQRDKTLLLTHIIDGRYRGDLEQLPQQRYYLRLQSPDIRWRLNGEMDFSAQAQTILGNKELNTKVLSADE